MMLQKWETAAIRSPALRESAKNQSCVACGVDDGTIVSAHLAIAGIADRGTGYKCDDFWIAHLCARCHTAADSGEYQQDVFWRAQMVARTLRRLFHQGWLIARRA